MNREKEILEYITPLFEKRYFDSCELIQKKFDRSEKITLNILKKFEDIFKKITLLQKEYNKGEIKYLYISYLRSSLLTKSYDFRIDFYDRNLYLDENPTYIYLSLDFIFYYYNDDILYFIEKLRKNFIRLQQYEIELIEEKYAFYYYKICAKFFFDLIKEIFHISNFCDMKKEKEIKVIFGEYMDRGILIYNYKQ